MSTPTDSERKVGCSVTVVRRAFVRLWRRFWVVYHDLEARAACNRGDLSDALHHSAKSFNHYSKLMIQSTHSTCNECPNDMRCGDQGECLAAQRQRSRRLLDRLSVGERFMLMFGRGVVKHDPLRVEWKDESKDQ